MIKKYKDLDSLIKQNSDANDYFNSLPDYVQGQIRQRVGHINSFDSLRDYAENLLRGDD